MCTYLVKTNTSSVRAHEKYGYSKVGEFQVIHILKLFMWRIKLDLPGHWRVSDGFKPDKRILLTGKKYADYINKHFN